MTLKVKPAVYFDMFVLELYLTGVPGILPKFYQIISCKVVHFSTNFTYNLKMKDNITLFE